MVLLDFAKAQGELGWLTQPYGKGVSTGDRGTYRHRDGNFYGNGDRDLHGGGNLHAGASLGMRTSIGMGVDELMWMADIHRD